MKFWKKSATPKTKQNNKAKTFIDKYFHKKYVVPVSVALFFGAAGVGFMLMSRAATGPAIFFIPSDGYETASMGAAIANHAASRETHVVLVTDGAASSGRTKLINAGYSEMNDVSKFVGARKNEFTAAALALGVPRANIHTDGLYPDGKLTLTNAKAIIQKYVSDYGANASYKTTSWLESHTDAKQLGLALDSFYSEGKITDARFYLTPSANISTSLKGGNEYNSSKVAEAIKQHKIMAPSIGRYAIAYNYAASTELKWQETNGGRSKYHVPTKYGQVTVAPTPTPTPAPSPTPAPAPAPTYGNDAVFIVPHQDDETISMGAAIANHVDSRRPVHLYVVTDGGASGVRTKLCTAAYNYQCLSYEDFVKARNVEVVDAAMALGVPRDNIHLMGYADGTLTYDKAVAIIGKIVSDHGPSASYKTTSWLEKHSDHIALGDALNRMCRSGQVTDCRFYHSPLHRTDSSIATSQVVTPRSGIEKNSAKVKAAVATYKNSRYKIAYLSSGKSLDWVSSYYSSKWHMNSDNYVSDTDRKIVEQWLAGGSGTTLAGDPTPANPTPVSSSTNWRRPFQDGVGNIGTQGHLTYTWYSVSSCDAGRNKHCAVDMSGNVGYGTKVYPVADGVVVKTGNQSSGSASCGYSTTGNCAIIEHADKTRTVYNHMKYTVKQGDRVTKDMSIGYLDGSGTGTGYHLHLMAINDGGTVVDAYQYMKDRGVRLITTYYRYYKGAYN